MSGHQQTIYTIHESQLNNGAGGQRRTEAGNNASSNNNNDILIDTSSIPMTNQATMPPMQYHHLEPQQAQQQQFASTGADTITSQPAGASSRVAPENQSMVYSVHPVFNMLDQHDALLIRQRADPTSTCCGFESANTYTVRARDGSPILQAVENSNCCERCCFEGNREFNLSLVHKEEVVARIRKSHRVNRFCCYTNAVRIESPEDNPIGHIRQLFTFFGHPRYAIYDCQQPPKRPSFILESVTCRFCCTPLLCTCMCGNKEFRVICCETREEVGTISRYWANSFAGQHPGEGGQLDGEHNQAVTEQEPFGGGQSSASQCSDQMFGIQFVANLEARHKVLLLSACFMMDFFYFENDRRRRKLASC